MKRHLCLLLILLFCCGCAAAVEAPSAALEAVEPSPCFTDEQLSAFTTVVFDKDGPGDLGYKAQLSDDELIDFADIMQIEEWSILENPPEHGAAVALQIADSDLNNIMYIMDGGELGTIIKVPSQSDGKSELFTAPAEVAKSAKEFYEALKYKHIKVKADSSRSAEEVIDAYFDAHYRSYLSMQDIDITELLDMEKDTNHKLITWLSMLNQRRRLIYENDLCYVETEAFPYQIVYDDEAEDNRMQFWKRRMDDDFDAVYHFRIRGEEGKAYPPTFALNSQHSIFLKQTDSGWKIVRHYYPGAVRNFYLNEGLAVLDDAAALELLEKEFAFAEQPEPVEIPEKALVYDPEKSVRYAMTYAEQSNPIYYNVGDWDGNCQNFVSQSVSSGFGYEGNPDPMTRRWFAGSGGGTVQWENCDYFWDFAVNQKGIGGQQLESVTQLIPGDVLQLRSLGRNEPDDFSHVIFTVDDQKLMFAQNSPPNFVYYSDLVNIEARFFRPQYLENHIIPQ